jgi:hypothetical protein
VFVFSPGDKVQRRVVQYLEFDLGAAILEGESSRGGGQVATGALPTDAQPAAVPVSCDGRGPLQNVIDLLDRNREAPLRCQRVIRVDHYDLAREAR